MVINYSNDHCMKIGIVAMTIVMHMGNRHCCHDNSHISDASANDMITHACRGASQLHQWLSELF